MTPQTLRRALAIIGWSQRGLADLLDVDERQVRRWATGATVPPAIAAWLTRLADFHEINPPPSRPPATASATHHPPMPTRTPARPSS